MLLHSGVRRNDNRGTPLLPVHASTSESRRLEHTRHTVFDAALCQLFIEHGANPRVFILVFDLIATRLDALGSAPLFAQAGKLAAAERLQRQIAGRLAADIEVLVEPALRRDEQTSRAPAVALYIFALPPHDRKTLSPQNDHMCAGAVPMG